MWRTFNLSEYFYIKPQISCILGRCMRRTSLKYLASLAFFTLGSGSLWGTDYYVVQGEGSGTSSLTCTTACQSDDPAINNCCTLINAVV